MVEQPAPNRKESLNLVILHRVMAQEYRIVAHNQTSEETKQLIEKGTPELKPGFSMVTIAQRKRHGSEADNCRACRETVARSSGLNPLPKFARRES